MKICIYGGASPNVEEKYLDAAYKTGRAIASRGHTLIFGGGKLGCMGACSRGVQDAGGEVISVFPDFLIRFEPRLTEDARVITTKTMDERKKLMEEMADAFIVLPGGVGTFDEFFEAVVLKELGKLDKPIVLMNADGFYDPVIDLIRHYTELGFVQAFVPGLIDTANDPEEAVRLAEKPRESEELS